MDRQKTAVVTGANRGMGLATVQALAEKGYRVVLTARKKADAEQAAKRLVDDGLLVIPHQLDVTDEESIAALAAFVEKELGRCDVLVNNAGGVFETFDHDHPEQHAAALKATTQSLQDSFETNALGAFLVSKALLLLMQREGYGRIVNVSSRMGQLSTMAGGNVGYRASKAAMNAFTRVLAAETKGDGIKVNASSPGWVRTDMGGEDAARSIAEGIDTTVWLATLPDDGPTGGFFHDRKPIDW